jgi:hypothetical protein
MKNKALYYEQAVECSNLIFWPESQRSVHCCTAKLELNLRVIIDWVRLVSYMNSMTHWFNIKLLAESWIVSVGDFGN